MAEWLKNVTHGLAQWFANVYIAVVTVAQALRVTTRGAVFTNTVEISSGELEELRIDSERGAAFLIAVSDKKTVKFGEGLPQAELEWLRAVLMRAVAAE